MDFSRIANVINVNEIATKRVAVFGCGASAGLVGNLTRSGVSRFRLFDFDSVSPANIARQHHDATDIGRLKVGALADDIRRINPNAIVDKFIDDFVEMSDDLIRNLVTECDLLIFATDRFAAQAKGNELALRYNIPALWVGLYADGKAGEIIFWHPDIDACYRCLCKKRYQAHATRAKDELSLDPSSDGCTIFDVTMLDSIAGMLAVGLLTRGTDNRFGGLIDDLGDRNFIQVQLDPSWTFNGENPVQKHLGVADDCAAFFAWNTIVRADPDHAFPPCPDCHKYRPECSATCHGVPLRLKTTAKAPFRQ